MENSYGDHLRQTLSRRGVNPFKENQYIVMDQDLHIREAEFLGIEPAKTISSTTLDTYSLEVFGAGPEEPIDRTYKSIEKLGNVVMSSTPGSSKLTISKDAPATYYIPEPREYYLDAEASIGKISKDAHLWDEPSSKNIQDSIDEMVNAATIANTTATITTIANTIIEVPIPVPEPNNPHDEYESMNYDDDYDEDYGDED